jgi:hypothetical protein
MEPRRRLTGVRRLRATVASIVAVVASQGCLSIGDSQSGDGGASNGGSKADSGLDDGAWTGGSAGTSSSGGSTSSGGASSGGGTGGCPSGQKTCSGQCVAIDDPAFGCGATTCASCSFPNATAKCSSGGCAFGSCNGSYKDCDKKTSNGCETDASSDVDNCGFCGDACGQNGSCVSGACDCAPGFTQCIGCVDLQTDVNNCGSCNNSCSPGLACISAICGGPP